MIRVEIRGENIEVTDAIREHIEEKVAKLERYFNDVPNTHAHVNIKVRNNKRGKVEITIPMKDLTLRAEEGHDDLYAAVDLVIDKLERQIRKHKTKINRKFREKNPEADFFNATAFENGAEEDNENNDEIAIFRSKEFTLKPMDSEEAVLQMNMLGHNFFMFMNGNTGEINVVYKRSEGNYAVLEPDKN